VVTKWVIVPLNISARLFGGDKLSFEFSILVAICILAVAATTGRWKSQIAHAKSVVYSKRARTIKLSENIRQQAKQTFLIKAAIKRCEALVEEKGAEVEKILGEISIFEKIDDRILIIDELRGRGESRWKATVLHDNYNGLISALAPIEHHNGWRAGRLCLVWAKDEQSAFQKLNKLYPQDDGFVIAKVASVASTNIIEEAKNG
jgi:hypothetical protein